MTFSFEYHKLDDFTYYLLTDPGEIKTYLMKWIMREWELDHNEAPNERWTVAWMATQDTRFCKDFSKKKFTLI